MFVVIRVEKNTLAVVELGFEERRWPGKSVLPGEECHSIRKL